MSDYTVTVTHSSGRVVFIGRPAGDGDVFQMVRTEGGQPTRLLCDLPDLTAQARVEPYSEEQPG